MSWFTQTLSSSIGKKVLMALTGLFLILFLVIHLAGNLQLILDESGEAFNVYATNMANNPLIKVVSYGNFAFILIHVILGFTLTKQNKTARGVQYHTTPNDSQSSWASKNMALMGTITLIFIIVHLQGIWYELKWGMNVTMVSYNGIEYKNAFLITKSVLTDPLYAGIYIISMIFLGFHLSHGFSSAFQSMGLNHKKYTPIISKLGLVYSILIPFGFAIIPIIMFLRG